MTSFLHSYLKTIISTAVICFFAIIITPDGKAKKGLNIACSAAMIMAMLSPVLDIDFTEYSKSLAEYKLKAQELAENGTEQSENLNRLYIQEQCGAYILDKAEQMDIKLEKVSVSAEWSDNGYWYPVSADIYYSDENGDKMRLERIIESDLGISGENINWCNQ